MNARGLHRLIQLANKYNLTDEYDIYISGDPNDNIIIINISE